MLSRMGFSIKECRLLGFSAFNVSLRRGFRTSFSAGKNSRARDVIKLLNSTSLTQKEREQGHWKRDLRLPEWKRQKFALKEKLGNQEWKPLKKLSREQMESVRLLKRQFPDMSAKQLGDQYKVSPEVIRRILKSTWEPTEEEMVDIQARWKRRGERMNDMMEQPSERKIVIGSSRSSANLMVKEVKKRHVSSSNFRDNKTTGPTQTKSRKKLQLLARLIK
ncbi:LAMI_0F14400g1_1 [Lachancea mirantina]|uniref:Required for respiratory growth protein 9, mitochondrial n=1 Tax=Lachancea mirantina TaxID=1230905 RepID=A0A1G4K3T6_9SACH|nr:LAMI_0F14400g1_1 [Lachancea mirantina]